MMSLMIFFVSFRLQLSRVEEISVYRWFIESLTRLFIFLFAVSFWLAPIDWKSDNLLHLIIALTDYQLKISFDASSTTKKLIFFLIIITCMGPSFGNMLSLFCWFTCYLIKSIDIQFSLTQFLWHLFETFDLRNNLSKQITTNNWENLWKYCETLKKKRDVRRHVCCFACAFVSNAQFFEREWDIFLNVLYSKVSSNPIIA